MTDNEIIKALEICGVDLDCKHCSFQGGLCVNKLINEALSLINRQKAEIDELQRRNSVLEIELQAMRGAANSYKAENKTLKMLLSTSNVEVVGDENETL